MAYLPRHQGQVGRGSTSRRDCGPRSVQMGIDALTHGQLVPDIPDLRIRMGTPGNVTTNVYDAERGVESYDHVPGRHDLHYRVVRTTGEAKDAVLHGRPVQLAIDYGDLNRTGRTGDPNFRDGHSVLVKGQRNRGSTIEWRLFDPLDDGRRQGIPQGPRWVSRERLVSALEAFQPGTVYAGVFTGGASRGGAPGMSAGRDR